VLWQDNDALWQMNINAPQSNAFQPASFGNPDVSVLNTAYFMSQSQKPHASHKPGWPIPREAKGWGIARGSAREKSLGRQGDHGISNYSSQVHRKVLPILLLLALVTFVLAISRTHTAIPLPTADSLLVIKHDHTLTLLRDGQPIKQYRVALGRGGLGPKQQAGDNKVPEGTYRIVSRNAHSTFYRALRVGYPTPQQAAAAHARGVDPGGDIMIHGIRNGLGWLGPAQRLVDWTKGCIAVTDPEMDEIWKAVPDGAPIEIRR